MLGRFPTALLALSLTAYRQAQYGFARGREPVRFVERVRRFYDLLLWHRDEDRVAPLRRAQALKIDSPVL